MTLHLNDFAFDREFCIPRLDTAIATFRETPQQSVGQDTSRGPRRPAAAPAVDDALSALVRRHRELRAA